MNKQDLLKRLNDIEWDDFEVKTAQSELPKTIWETVSAFAYEDNTQLDALREGLVNMLMHADYFSVMHSTIRVFSNRIVFQNSGRFYIDIEEARKLAISKPRNPVIARFFRWANLAENAGFGFDKMLNWKHKNDI